MTRSIGYLWCLLIIQSVGLGLNVEVNNVSRFNMSHRLLYWMTSSFDTAATSCASNVWLVRLKSLQLRIHVSADHI